MTVDEIVADASKPEGPKLGKGRRLALGSTSRGARHLPASLNYDARMVTGVHMVLSRLENGEHSCGDRRIPRSARSSLIKRNCSHH